MPGSNPGFSEHLPSHIDSRAGDNFAQRTFGNTNETVHLRHRACQSITVVTLVPITGHAFDSMPHRMKHVISPTSVHQPLNYGAGYWTVWDMNKLKEIFQSCKYYVMVSIGCCLFVYYFAIW